MATTVKPHIGGDSIVTVYFVSAFLLIGAIWILVANVLIICAPFVQTSLKKNTYSYLFISSLATADCVTAIFVPAAWFTGTTKHTAPQWYHRVKSKALCQMVLFFYIFPFICSVLNLLLIAVDRYISVVQPHQYKRILNKGRCKFLIGMCWFISMVFSSINFVWNRHDKSEDFDCSLMDIAPLYFHCVLALMYWLSSLLIVVLYFLIGVTTRKSKDIVRSGRQPVSQIPQAQSHDNVEKRLFKTMLITVSVFLICWTPFVLLIHLTVSELVGKTAAFVPMALTYSNSGMNIFIYALKFKSYRVAFKKIVQRCGKKC